MPHQQTLWPSGEPPTPSPPHTTGITGAQGHRYRLAGSRTGWEVGHRVADSQLLTFGKLRRSCQPSTSQNLTRGC